MKQININGKWYDVEHIASRVDHDGEYCVMYWEAEDGVEFATDAWIHADDLPTRLRDKSPFTPEQEARIREIADAVIEARVDAGGRIK